ncbi:MAG TPA: hypothetical protein VMU33_15935 [Burkholderiaceae bacterium]|nr:hypothetical protein [Burkholderiaceae bacterium]
MSHRYHVRPPSSAGRLLVMAVLAAATHAVTARAADAPPLAEHPIVAAVARGDCPAAVELLNRDSEANDPQAIFLAGRMLDEGICVKQDHDAATRFFSRSAELGDNEAKLELAAKFGLGQGTEQDYAKAGAICHAAGIDPEGKVSPYALGYACTVRSIAARLARDSMPPNAIRPGASGIAQVEFRTASSTLRVRSAPRLAVESDAPTGSMIRRGRGDSTHAIEEAWSGALASVPKPEAARLDDQPVALPLDVGPMLVVGAANAPKDDSVELLRAMMRGTMSVGKSSGAAN